MYVSYYVSYYVPGQNINLSSTLETLQVKDNLIQGESRIIFIRKAKNNQQNFVLNKL